MRRATLLFISLLLSGCATQSDETRLTPVSVYSLARAPAQNATVIIGMSVRNPRRVIGLPGAVRTGWIQVDSFTGERINLQEIDIQMMCLANHACSGGTSYKILSVPPGTYGLGWVINIAPYIFARTTHALITSRDGIVMSVKLPKTASIPINDLSFTVQAGDVAYVGDLILDFDGDGHLHLERGRSEDAAKAVLGPSNLANRMIVAGWADSITPNQGTSSP